MVDINSSWSPAVFLAPLHLLSYSTLLGTELYQSFVVTKICYQALPRSAFNTLQKRVFPIYFRSQALLLLLTASLLNLTIYGPRTRQIMIDRIHQETRDGRKLSSITELSDDMKALNRSFSRNHAMSIHLNLISIVAMIWWGWKLASRLEFRV
ncbi:hypothetical protein M434DRAFT_23514 [Hypoxylon sp. CO27-5]|nr:hypothetical protein M434DRAFT_23514 [Hypoxylon sp. CO27-5]